MCAFLAVTVMLSAVARRAITFCVITWGTVKLCIVARALVARLARGIVTRCPVAIAITASFSVPSMLFRVRRAIRATRWTSGTSISAIAITGSFWFACRWLLITIPPLDHVAKFLHLTGETANLLLHFLHAAKDSAIRTFSLFVPNVLAHLTRHFLQAVGRIVEARRTKVLDGFHQMSETRAGIGR
jgi:hypothetical protein